LNGKRNGQGIYYFANNDKYTGNFEDGFFSGNNGTFQWFSGDRYTGSFSRGQIHGTGKKSFVDGSSITGTFRQGLANGVCVKEYACGSKYFGNFKNDKREGFGTCRWSNNAGTYSGLWLNDRITGEGCRVECSLASDPKKVLASQSHRCEVDVAPLGSSPRGSSGSPLNPCYKGLVIEYSGDCINEVFEGYGKIIYGASKDCINEVFEGQFCSGLYEGYGRLENHITGDIYHGDFISGKFISVSYTKFFNLPCREKAWYWIDDVWCFIF